MLDGPFGQKRIGKKMIVKINNQKYQKLDYARLKDLVDSIINLSDYDINIEFDSLNWLQVFKENGYVSIAHRIDEKVFQYFKLNEEDKVKEIIKEYFFDKKLFIKQKPDDIVAAKNKSDVNWLGLIIIVSSLVFISLFKDNVKYFNFGFLFFSIGIGITTYKRLINKENDTRNDIMFFFGIILFAFMLLRIVIQLV